MKLAILFGVAFSTAVLLGCSSQQKDEPPARISDTVENAGPNGAAKIKRVRAALDEAKQNLADEHKYNCCVKPACDFCALQEESCPCYDELKAGEHVCIECYAGWQQGRGMDPEVKKESVTTSFLKHEHHH